MSQGLELISPRAYEKFLELLKTLGIDDHVVSIEPLSGVNSNFGSFIVKAFVEAQKLQIFILKCGTNGENNTLGLAIDKFFDREIYYYRNVFPEFEKLQLEKNIEPITFYPKFFGSLGERYNELLIMEDMTALGYVEKQQLETLDYDHVLVVLKEYAKLHALSFALRDQKQKVFKDLGRNVYDHHFTKLSQRFQRINSKGFKQMLSYFEDDQYKNLYQELAKIYVDYPNLMDEVFESELTSDHGVFTHTDCRLGNMLFKYDSNGVIEKVCLLDWQLGMLASPAVDLIYVIFVNTDKPLRDKHYDDFINYYYDTFSKFLLKLGSDPELLFPLETLHKHMKKYAVEAVMFTTLFSYLISLGVEKDSPDQYLFSNRIKDIIIDCYNLGYLSK